MLMSKQVMFLLASGQKLFNYKNQHLYVNPISLTGTDTRFLRHSITVMKAFAAFLEMPFISFDAY